MSENKLHRIPLPSETPTSIDDYRKQNYLLQKTSELCLGFDGVKLGNWNEGNTELPYILAGSVIEFLGVLFETREDIILVDEIDTLVTELSITFTAEFDIADIESIENIETLEDYKKYLHTIEYITPKVDYANAAPYASELRGFYRGAILSNTSLGCIKQLRVSMKKENEKYLSKKYYDKDDVNKTGEALKKYSRTYKIPGTFSFDFPMEAESIIFQIKSGGGGGGGYADQNEPRTNGLDGEKSEILIEAKVITSCGGGSGGMDATYGWILGPLNGVGGDGGEATGKGELINGNAGGNGTNQHTDSGIPKGDGRGGVASDRVLAIGGDGGDSSHEARWGYYAGGGGAGSSAIVEVLRSELGETSTITITVGGGGAPSSSMWNNDKAEAGENGSVYLEYYV